VKFFSFITKVNKYFAIISGILIGVVGLFATYEAIARGVFSSPTIWSSDLSRYVMIWAIFLGTASAFLDKTHISVDFVRELAGKKWGTGVQRVLAILGYLFTLVYIAALGWCSQDLFFEALKEGKLTYGTIQFPVAYLYLAMVIGSLLMVATVVPIIAGLIGKKNDYL
jgi:TRAP-type C4-dicarboxylate transport system permease small subunit